MDLSMIVMSHDYSELLSNGLQNDPNFLMIFNSVIREVKLIYIPVNAKFRRLIFSPWKTPKTDIFSEKWLSYWWTQCYQSQSFSTNLFLLWRLHRNAGKQIRVAFETRKE